MQVKVNSNQILGDLVSGLFSDASLDGRFAFYAKTIEKLRFDGVYYSFSPRSSSQPSLQSTSVFKFCNKFSIAFFERYAQENWQNHGFSICEIQENKLNIKESMKTLGN